MHCVRDGFSEIIEWSKDTKKLSKEWVDDDSEKKIPNKKAVNGGFGDSAFFPSDSGMEKIS